MTLILLALAWLAAIASVALWGMPWWLVPALLVACLPLVAFQLGPRATAMVAAAAVLSAVGAGLFTAWQNRDTPTLASFAGEQVTLDGVIASEPDPSDFNNSYTVRVETLHAAGFAARPTGKLRVSLPADTEYLPGTRLRLTGQLQEAPVFPDFDYRSFLNRQDIVATMSRPSVEVLGSPPDFAVATDVTRVRLALDHSLQRALPEPEASLAGGIAFGRDGNLPDNLYDDFRDAGLAHIVAVSGSNVSLVAALTFAIFTWLIGRRLAFLPVALTVLGYLLIAGLSASVVRAGIMAGVYLLGAYLGRQRSSLSALAAAAMVMTAYQPSASLDLGFQLSLAATAGLIVFGPWIRFGIEAGAARIGVSRVPNVFRPGDVAVACGELRHHAGRLAELRAHLTHLATHEHRGRAGIPSRVLA